MPRTNRNWARRCRRSWQPEEERKLVEMASVGLSSEYYATQLPGRTFGEILERRLDLIEQGALNRPVPL